MANSSVLVPWKRMLYRGLLTCYCGDSWDLRVVVSGIHGGMQRKRCPKKFVSNRSFPSS